MLLLFVSGMLGIRFILLQSSSSSDKIPRLSTFLSLCIGATWRPRILKRKGQTPALYLAHHQNTKIPLMRRLVTSTRNPSSSSRANPDFKNPNPLRQAFHDRPSERVDVCLIVISKPLVLSKTGSDDISSNKTGFLRTARSARSKER